MGGRMMPTVCPHGVTVDCGDFGPDPDDGAVGAGVCAVCETASPDHSKRIIERLRAAVKLLYPDEMTPQAKRILERIIDEEMEKGQG